MRKMSFTMGKRASEANDWASFTKESGDVSLQKRKKRKIASETDGPDVAAVAEDKYDASRKKEKKTKKDKRIDQELENGVDTNGTVQDEPAVKERRRREKKAAKEAASTFPVADESLDGTSKENVTPEDEKAARKAEKKRRNAEKRDRKQAEAMDHTHEAGVENSVEKTTTLGSLASDNVDLRDQHLTALKAKKKHSKALNKAATASIDGSADGVLNSGFNDTKVDSASFDSYTESEDLSNLPQSQIDAYLASNFIDIEDPQNKRALRPILNFSHLPQSALREPNPFATFKSPTPIQAAAWPSLLSGRDVVGVAETGSGKTLAFGIPCIRYVTAALKTKSSSKPKNSGKAKSKGPALAAIVSPTRELAVQIHEQINVLAAPANIIATCVYGGVPKESQRSAVQEANIITATPGRLKDLIEEGYADLSGVSYLVLDEADRMLDKGFEEDIKSIISRTLPTHKRQTLMFTATWPQSVRALASTFMRSPVKISIGENSASGELRANTRIEQRVEVLDTQMHTKERRLLELLKELQGHKGKDKFKQPDSRILIFALYKKEAARIESFLRSHKHRVAGIHGDLSQPARTAALEAFKAGTTPLLVATDVAARGLDIPAVKAVINVTFPLTVEDYVHRIGRTGRAGKSGLAFTFFTEHEKGLAGGLANVLRAAGQEVPEELKKFGGTVKKKGHDGYGAFYREPAEGAKQSTKITFDE